MHMVGGRHARPEASSPQQSGLPAGQQRKALPAPVDGVATVPGGQQPVVPIARAFGQHRRVITIADGTRPAADPAMQTSLVLQQLSPQHFSPLSQQRSPQHVWLLPQQWSPQHCSPALQQSFLPQHVSAVLQHFSPQHVFALGQQ
jgi:hypothetical protein